MRNILKLFTLSLLAACAGTDTTETVDNTAWLTNPDGDVSMISLEEACFEHPEAGFCTGSSSQAWTSEQHHGIAWNTTHPAGSNQSPTCHSTEDTGGTNTTCYFPKLKQVNVTFDETACWNYQTLDTLTIQDAISRIKTGILSWNGAGTGVSVTINGSDANKMPVLAVCADLSGVSWPADAQLVSTDESYGATDARTPTAPNGENRGFFKKINGGLLRFDIKKLLSSYSNCDSSPTTTERRAFLSVTGQHEQGHIMGFGHFKTNAGGAGNPFMGPVCNVVPQSLPVIPTPFKNALGSFETITVPSGQQATILDHNLDDRDPN